MSKILQQFIITAYTGGLFGCSAVIAFSYMFSLRGYIVERFNWLFPIFWLSALGASFLLLNHDKRRACIGFAALLFLLLAMLATPIVAE